jgi:phospho-N-acetylmuramoyl-pentapeptide-transferase
MFPHFLHHLSPALDKTTLRAALAALVSFLLAVVLGPKVIAWLGTRFRESIRSDSEKIRQLHATKNATPTMGGLFIVAGLVAGSLALGDLSSPLLWLVLLTTIALATLGAVDDLTKLRGPGKGLSARTKLAGQLLIASVAAVLLYQLEPLAACDGALSIPGVGALPLGWTFIPLAVLVIVGSSNAVNLTDGLDGLAGGCVIFSAAAVAALVYVAGHAEWAAYLGVPHVPGASEMVVVAAALIGAMLGFLWFNCHPAQVFMGDTGSLAVGGLLGLLAVIARQEILWAIVGGVFVLEAASVLLQVGYFKWRRQRLFRCAPLHHHFQFLGWPEGKIVVRFWIVAALCAVVGLAGLKLSIHERPTLVNHSTTNLLR